MAVTIMKGKYKEVKPDGSVVLYHFETDADIVKDGASKKVPAKTDITNWDNIRTEVINARGIALNLNARLNGFDESLKATSLLSAIKTVDGPESGLNADFVDDCGVDDSAAASTSVLWTSGKINTELGKKVSNTEVVTTPTANKILKLNATGLLPTGITGNAATATSLATERKIIIEGDATGEVGFNGTKDVKLSLEINNNSHDHGAIKHNGSTEIENVGTTGNITAFKINGVVKSNIDANGNFTGKAADASKVGGKTVDDTKLTNEYIWTAAKVLDALTGKMDKNAIGAGSNYMLMNGLIVQWGTADLTNKTSLVVAFPMLFTETPTVMISDESLDFTWICKRKPLATTASQFEVICNKAVIDAKVNWVAFGKPLIAEEV